MWCFKNRIREPCDVIVEAHESISGLWSSTFYLSGELHNSMLQLHNEATLFAIMVLHQPIFAAP